jgi:hypothetical protein
MRDATVASAKADLACRFDADPATGLTPMLQAIYANQVEVVKELMMAGQSKLLFLSLMARTKRLMSLRDRRRLPPSPYRNLRAGHPRCSLPSASSRPVWYASCPCALCAYAQPGFVERVCWIRICSHLPRKRSAPDVGVSGEAP